MLWFVVIVAMIPLALWLLRRSPVGAGLTGATRGTASGTPRLVAMLPLSAQHKLVTVEVGHGEHRQWLVMGVSPQGLQTLHAMPPGEPSSPAQNVAPQAAFAQLYDRLRSGKSSDQGEP